MNDKEFIKFVRDLPKSSPGASMILGDLPMFAALHEAQSHREDLTHKSLDIPKSSEYMANGDDSSAGLFSPDQNPKINEKCPKCNRTATEETVTECQDPDCPYNYFKKIRGDAEPEGVKEKEESDGEETK